MLRQRSSADSAALEKGGRLATVLAFVFGAWILLQQPLNILRMSGAVLPGAQDIWALFYWPLYFFLIGITLYACLTALARARSRLALPHLLLLAFFFFAYVLVVGLLRGGGSQAFEDAVQFYLIGPAVFYACVANPGSDRWLFSKRLMGFVLFVHLIAVAIYYWALVGVIHPGFGTQSLAYATLLFLKTGGYFVALFGVLLVLLEGKRGTLIALIFGLVWSARALNRGVLRHGAGKTAVFLVVISVIGLGGLSALASLGESSPAVARLQYINPLSSSFDLYRGSSGRAGEIISAFSEVQRTEGAILIGTGTGFTYEWDVGYERNTDYETTKGYMHASYLNYMMHGGVLLGIILVIAITYNCLYRGWKGGAALRDPRLNIAATMCATSWMQSWFGFGTASDPLFWAILGSVFLCLRRVAGQRQEAAATAARPANTIANSYI